jgi:hypothetical protein
MARAIAQPPPVVDAFHQPPDSPVIIRNPETAAPYRAAAAEVTRRRESGLPPAGSVQVTTGPAASVPQLPMVGVARAYAGHEITRLKAQAETLERDLSVPPVGASGQQIPHLVEAQRQASAALEDIRAQIDRFNQMTDEETVTWAIQRPQSGRG